MNGHRFNASNTPGTSIGFIRCVEAGFAVDTALRLFPVEKRPS